MSLFSGKNVLHYLEPVNNGNLFAASLRTGATFVTDINTVIGSLFAGTDEAPGCTGVTVVGAG